MGVCVCVCVFFLKSSMPENILIGHTKGLFFFYYLVYTADFWGFILLAYTKFVYLDYKLFFY